VADLPTCVGVLPPARPATNCRLTSGADPSARHVPNFRLSPVVVAAFSLRLLPLRLLQLALAVARLPYRRRTSDSHRLLRHPALPVSIRPTCVGRFYLRLGLRCTPCFNRTLHRRQAVDEYSVSTGPCTLRICQLNNFRLASTFAISGATSDPSAAFASGFTLWLGLRRFSDSRQLFVPHAIPATNSQCPTGHQLNETVRPFNLWKQVQKSS